MTSWCGVGREEAGGLKKPRGPALGRPDDKLHALRRSGTKDGRRSTATSANVLRRTGAMRSAYCALRVCSPDGAKRNPGRTSKLTRPAPEYPYAPSGLQSPK